MERRCRFLDNMPAFNYNTGVGEYIQTDRTDTKKLGSTLMETMLREVADFCDPKIKESWTQKGHQQVGTRYTLCKMRVYSNIIKWFIYYLYMELHRFNLCTP